MKPEEIVKALRCIVAPGMDPDCKECPYFYRDEPSPEVKEEYGDVPNAFWAGCNCDKIALDAADLIEQLQKEAGIVGTTDI